ncbi:PREDICTED: uncharacterized protein LOC104748204 [Camelina sativa]|uniref:Uncharacterized protein LOC104748204 n=1 Tax=Camelina sativa TaxID=90675 RepID=A0ABM0WAP3_CAMSA|nr:PREDICTED: uncharacterized protein LOC104748204 [Camelina sativa]
MEPSMLQLRLASSSMVKSPTRSQILSTSRGSAQINLCENFNKSSVAREFSLRCSLQLLLKKDKSLSTYYREFKNICDSLSSIGKPVDESMKIFGFLNGLGREYDPIATVIQSSLTKLPTPTFNDVVNEVQSFDCKLQSYEDATAVTPHLAFNTEKTNPSDPQFASRGRGRGSGQNRGRGGYSTRGRGFTQHQSSSPSSGQRPVCQICGRTGHTALKCYNRFDNNYQAEAVQAFSSLRVSDGNEWHPDSGATAHVTPSTDNLHSATTYEGNDTVMVGDGNFGGLT